MVEGVVLAEIFNSSLIRCVDTLTGVQEVPEVSPPLRAVQGACVSRALSLAADLGRVLTGTLVLVKMHSHAEQRELC